MNSPEPDYPTPNEQRIMDLEEALNDLINLNDHKEKHGEDALYLDFKPRAWRVAKEVMSRK